MTNSILIRQSTYSFDLVFLLFSKYVLVSRSTTSLGRSFWRFRHNIGRVTWQRDFFIWSKLPGKICKIQIIFSLLKYEFIIFFSLDIIWHRRYMSTYLLVTGWYPGSRYNVGDLPVENLDPSHVTCGHTRYRDSLDFPTTFNIFTKKWCLYNKGYNRDILIFSSNIFFLFVPSRSLIYFVIQPFK